MIHPIRSVLTHPGDALPELYSVSALGLGFILVYSEWDSGQAT